MPMIRPLAALVLACTLACVSPSPAQAAQFNVLLFTKSTA